jgi:caffeoyl-CoA O-methyltransferase
VWRVGAAMCPGWATYPEGMPRTIVMNPSLEHYVADHTNPSSDEVAQRLAQRTAEQFGDQAGMNIGIDQGLLLKMLVELMGARSVVEIGTFTGMSALWLARGLSAGGRLTCFERWERPLELARLAWQEAGVADRIDVVVGDAVETIAATDANWSIDMAFIDADKPNYRRYVEAILARLAEGGLIAVDNTLWSGAVVDLDVADPNTVAIREFNSWLARRADLEVVIVPIGDGLTLLRRR